MTSTLGGKAPKNIYIGDKQAVIMYKGTDIIWSTKFKVGAIIGQAVSTADGSGEYTLDNSKAGWKKGRYNGNTSNAIYTFPNSPIYKLPNGIKLRFWNSIYGVQSNTTSISASDIAKGVDIKVDDTWKDVNGTVHSTQVDARVQERLYLEIITFGAHIELYEITAY